MTRCLIGRVIVAAGCLLLGTTAHADGIIVDGVVHSDISLYETPHRFYWRTSSGDAKSVAKSAVRQGEFWYGDRPTPAIESPIVVPLNAPAAGAADLESPAGSTIAVPATKEASPGDEQAPGEDSTEVLDSNETLAPGFPEPDAGISTPTPEVEVVDLNPVEAVRPVWPEPSPIFAGKDIVRVDSPAGAACEINTLVLKAGDAEVAFCAMDCAAIGEGLVAGVIERLEAAGSAIDAGNLIMTSTGVHTSLFGGVAGSKVLEAQWGSMDPEDLNTAADMIALSVGRAEAALVPGTVRHGEREAPQFHRRRGPEEAPLDSALNVLCLEDAKGERLGVIVNYALQPPIDSATDLQNTAGIPGELRERLREQWGSDAAVLFVNGAAEDVLPAHEDAVPGSIAAGLSAMIGDICDQTEAREMAGLWVQAYDCALPPSLLGRLVQTQVRIHEVWLDRTLLVSGTGLPAGEIGMLVRVKAMAEGAEAVFLLCQAGPYTGCHPTIAEYWTDSSCSKSAFYGPLMVNWYGENMLPYHADLMPIWEQVPAISIFSTAFRRGLDLGTTRADFIENAWVQNGSGLDALVGALDNRLESVPEELKFLLRQLDGDEASLALRQFTAAYLRTEQEELTYTAEQRALLMGVAEGAVQPFDSVFLLQILGRREALPREINAVIELVEEVNKVTMPGLDFFAL